MVPHTHWDREWYEPFQTFRLKLVRLLDGLIDLLERDPSYSSFLLDGQLAMVEDYLEVRPANAGRLSALAAAGRLTIGPWYILMDEFLVSAETIVRNLQLGIRTGSVFGQVMEVGYLPDMFGHVAQMPQILAQAGFDHAVVWRGVPSNVDATAFVWRAPDGSQVRAEYLVTGYGNGAAVPEDATALLRRLHSLEEEYGSLLGAGDPLLFMNGTDHQGPQPWLGQTVAEANRLQRSFELAITSLPEYLGSLGTEGLPSWRGEMRSGFRSNILMGVCSNRVDVKQSAARAERSLERMAEPLNALYLTADEWPGAFLELAWKSMILNAAHDSICACSVDQVVDAVTHRYGEASQIADGLTETALAVIGASLRAPGMAVVNPTARPRSGVVEAVVPFDGRPMADMQIISVPADVEGTVTLDGPTARTMLGLVQGSRLDDDAYVTEVSLAEDDTGLDLTLVVSTEPRADAPVEALKRELFTRLTARPDTEVRITFLQPAARRVVARQAEVAGFGWSAFSPCRLDHPVTVHGEAGEGLTLTNGLVTVVFDAGDGSFSLDDLPGYGRLVDSGDHGDTYNYSPPLHDTVVDTPDSVTLAALERGPVRATVSIVSTYKWPARVDEESHSRTGSKPVAITTTVELRADESAVRVHTRFDNPSRDHRLRVHLPLREPARTSKAECAFTVVERGLTAEGRPEELGLPTFPSRRFVCAGGLTVVHEGVVEYELIDVAPSQEGDPAASTLALTLLRSTGMLSRLGMTNRPFPAGPRLPVEGPQMIGPVEARYALCVDGSDPYELADDILVPLATVHGSGGGSRPASGTPLTVTGAEVSSVRRVAGSLELRVFNPTDRPVEVTVAERRGWIVDLRNRPLTSFEGSFELRSQGIATVLLD